jgi:XRE family aerobic/anaerobic benzoate catabolism transcriptional regulator
MNNVSPLTSVSSDAVPQADADFLIGVGRQVRELRERRGMTRKLLARQADVSERYLGQLEAGEGNISIILLRRVATALGARASDFLEPDQSRLEERLIRRFLEQIPPHRVEDVLVRLARELGAEREARRGRIALIGLRGAGKSTLGEQLARELDVPFIELDRVIEQEAGLPLAELFSLYGQGGYRRFEQRCLERVVKEFPKAVLSVGGGVVSEPATFDLLLSNCFTIWLKAKPEEYMQRVIAQGDLRPMADNAEALEDLKRILQAREPQYQKADAAVETSGRSIPETLGRLRDAIARA